VRLHLLALPDAVLARQCLEGNSEPDAGSLGHGEDLEPVDDGQPRAQPQLCVVQVASATSGATYYFLCPVCLAGYAHVQEAVSFQPKMSASLCAQETGSKGRCWTVETASTNRLTSAAWKGRYRNRIHGIKPTWRGAPDVPDHCPEAMGSGTCRARHAQPLCAA
jgi:hypothetical protein